MYTICYLVSIKIMEAYCVVQVNTMLPWQYQDNGNIVCREGPQYTTLAVLR